LELHNLGLKIQELSDCLRDLAPLGDKVENASDLIADSFRRGNKLLLCGNGGSAAEAQHVAAEYTSSLRSSFSPKILARHRSDD